MLATQGRLERFGYPSGAAAELVGGACKLRYKTVHTDGHFRFQWQQLAH